MAPGYEVRGISRLSAADGQNPELGRWCITVFRGFIHRNWCEVGSVSLQYDPIDSFVRFATALC